jgi:hypothetical protein
MSKTNFEYGELKKKKNQPTELSFFFLQGPWKGRFFGVLIVSPLERRPFQYKKMPASVLAKAELGCSHFLGSFLFDKLQPSEFFFEPAIRISTATAHR